MNNIRGRKLNISTEYQWIIVFTEQNLLTPQGSLIFVKGSVLPILKT